MRETLLLLGLLEEKIEELRGKFSKDVDNVEGVGPDSEVKDYHPSARYANEKKSLC